jgi:preprotein translocase subunit SecG
MDISSVISGILQIAFISGWIWFFIRGSLVLATVLFFASIAVGIIDNYRENKKSERERMVNRHG